MGATPPHDMAGIEATLQRYRERTIVNPAEWTTCRLVLSMELERAGHDKPVARAMAQQLVTQLRQQQGVTPTLPVRLQSESQLPAPKRQRMIFELPPPTVAAGSHDIAATQARIQQLQAKNVTLARTLQHLDRDGLYARAAEPYRAEMTGNLRGKLRLAGATEAEIPLLLEAIVQQFQINFKNPEMQAHAVLRFDGVDAKSSCGRY